MWKKLFSTDSKFTQILYKTGEVVILSILWFVTSIPVITIGTSTSALYYTIVKCIRSGRGYPVKEYFKSWKQNFGKGLILTLFLLAIVVFVAYYLQRLGISIEDVLNNEAKSEFFSRSESLVGLSAICAGIAVIAAVLFIYIFPLLSRFNLSSGRLLAMAFVISIRYFYFSIALMIITVALVNLVVRLPLGIMFAPGIWALVSSTMIEKTMKKYLPEPSPEEDAWWAEL